MEDNQDQSANVARMQCDALMTLLVSQCYSQLQKLALLSGPEKSATVNLVIIGMAMGVYECTGQADDEVRKSFRRALSELSPSLMRKLDGARVMRPEIVGRVTEAGAEHVFAYLKDLLSMMMAPDSAQRAPVVGCGLSRSGKNRGAIDEEQK